MDKPVRFVISFIKSFLFMDNKQLISRESVTRLLFVQSVMMYRYKVN